MSTRRVSFIKSAPFLIRPSDCIATVIAMVHHVDAALKIWLGFVHLCALSHMPTTTDDTLVVGRIVGGCEEL